jgi:hypothetical protein
MALPTLTPASTVSAIVLPSASSDSAAIVAASLPTGVYTSSEFVTGALKQVSYVYKKLGGDVLDIELTKGNVYSSYEEACLEYSYILNLHHSKNILSNVLGSSTGSFDHKGELTGSFTENIALKLPKVRFEYASRVAEAFETRVGIGGSETIYSASINTAVGQQDYDLQTLISSSAASDSALLYSDVNLGDNKIGNRKVSIKKVYYKSPQAMWRFFGYYGGLNVIGNLYSYGQYGDDSTFEIIPSWQNKLQAMAFEDSIYTRLSHFSYEIKNNKLRLFPSVTQQQPSKLWVEFTVQTDPWVDEAGKETGVNGINNMNTIPMANLPYENINSIGKHWIRRFSLALTKEILGQIRGKFSTVPIPGESVTLNHSELLSQAKEEQTSLRDELKEILDELTYQKLMEQDMAISDAANNIQKNYPLLIFTG